ncbi:glycosyl transferase [Polynucleobacter tropicus]|uniref:Glycosyl transferase n=1 Tax=Polynucleobacter tropicus TaxID=1743174 RepID=A0A6M9PYK9_9BURK|nr:glycosyltransferase [Polynucleobacter tropicus]QKM64067.1 glycosyl transferase [Polynucleobacter tropicus]
MIGLILAFLLSFITTSLLIRYKKLHQKFSADSDFSGPQKFHQFPVPRVGGIGIALGAVFAILIRFSYGQGFGVETLLLLCAIPAFAIGMTEDITKKISVRARLIFTAIGAGLFVSLSHMRILGVGIPHIDSIISIPGVGGLLTIFAITGLSNAYNIIDGFNGLASMVGIITLLAIGYISYVLMDPLLMYTSLIMASAILGFFVWNYPRGLIFLGDGGAYLIGFWIACLSIILAYKHHEVSPWFCLMINGYPVIETLFSIYRRTIHQNKSPGQPDGMHFHTLIYRRILIKDQCDDHLFSANAKTAPYLWIMAGLSVMPATLFWNSTHILALSWFIFLSIYMWIYSRIVNFRTPFWMRIS